MPDKSTEEKTEKATPRKQQKAREEGSVANSREMNSTAVLLAGVSAVFFMKNFFFEQWAGNFTAICQSFPSVATLEMDVLEYLKNSIKTTSIIVAPLLFIVMAAGVAVSVSQVGFNIALKALAPDLNKLNPVEGIKKMFSKKNVVELIKAVLKITFVGFVSYFFIKSTMGDIIPLMNSTGVQIYAFIAKQIFVLALVCLSLIALLSIGDFIFQKKDMERELMMSRRELKEEFKQTEGNPQIKSKIKSIMKKMASQRMMQEVPNANVVVTNPTHLAVAIKYKSGMKAPIVVAKGAQLVAKKIVQIARLNSVPVIENKPVARTLFKLVEIGEQIPANLYKAVAEILAYLHRLKNKRASA